MYAGCKLGAVVGIAYSGTGCRIVGAVYFFAVAVYAQAGYCAEGIAVVVYGGGFQRYFDAACAFCIGSDGEVGGCAGCA